MSKFNDRFVCVHKEGSSFSSRGLVQVLVDRETGVNYLWINSGYAGGLAPLFDSTGKPKITSLSELELS